MYSMMHEHNQNKKNANLVLNKMEEIRNEFIFFCQIELKILTNDNKKSFKNTLRDQSILCVVDTFLLTRIEFRISFYFSVLTLNIIKRIKFENEEKNRINQ